MKPIPGTVTDPAALRAALQATTSVNLDELREFSRQLLGDISLFRLKCAEIGADKLVYRTIKEPGTFAHELQNCFLTLEQPAK